MVTHVLHPGGPARIVYLGSPEIAVEPLQALVAAGHDVALVVTNPDRRRGRGTEKTPTPVKQAAIELGLNVSHDLDDVLAVRAQLGVVVAYGHIIGKHILDAVPMVNIHFSLLPRWRGAAPLERAILAGDAVTGVCLMEIAEALDEGNVFARREVVIGDLSLDELRDDLVEASCDLLIDSLEAGLTDPEPQIGEPVYARKLRREDFALDFSQSAIQNARVVRLGRAFTTVRGKRLGVLAAALDATPHDHVPGALDGHRVATGKGWLILEVVQPEGKKATDAGDWIRGARLDPDELLGT